MTEENNTTATIPQNKGKVDKRYRKVVRKKVVVEEEVDDFPDPKKYEIVTFRFYNERQRNCPIYYEWVDKWTKIGEYKGHFYDGGTYKLPRVAFEYYRDRCGIPIRENVEQEIYPGKTGMIPKVVGWERFYRLEEIKAA